jgi:hypothetical protein
MPELIIDTLNRHPQKAHRSSGRDVLPGSRRRAGRRKIFNIDVDMVVGWQYAV